MPDVGGRVAHGEDLGMRRRIAGQLALVVTCGHDLVVEQDDGPDGDVTVGGRRTCFRERVLHRHVVCGRRHGTELKHLRDDFSPCGNIVTIGSVLNCTIHDRSETDMSDPTTPITDLSSRRVLVTGASSGLGFEAAAQLAEAGYGSIVLAARTADKAAAARGELVERTGRDVFETLAADVALVAESRRAAADLADRGRPFDALLLNAGMVPSELHRTAEGIEVCFASSLVGHHVITTELIEAGLLAPDARVVIVGSEAANADLPKAMGMQVAEFALDADGARFAEAFEEFAHGDQPRFDANGQYATTKVVSAWWSASMQRRHQDRYDFYTVSPGANVGTNAARHTTGAFKLMISVMGRFGHLVGMNMPVPEGAKRYVDVILDRGDFEPGRTYTSKPKKMVGELVVRSEPHLVDGRRQDEALAALESVVAVAAGTPSA